MDNNMGAIVPASSWQQQCKKEKKFCDMIIYAVDGHANNLTSPSAANGNGIMAHKVVLGNSSPFFRNLLVASKDDQRDFIISGISTNTLDIFIDYLYTGKLAVDIKLSNAMNMLVGAKKFQQDLIVQQCENCIKTNINTDNCANTLRLAWPIESKVLIDASMQFLLKNLSDTGKTEGFFQLSMEHFQAIIKEHKTHVCPSPKLMTSIIEWAVKDLRARRKQVASLLITLYEMEEDNKMRSSLFQNLVNWSVEMSQRSVREDETGGTLLLPTIQGNHTNGLLLALPPPTSTSTPASSSNRIGENGHGSTSQDSIKRVAVSPVSSSTKSTHSPYKKLKRCEKPHKSSKDEGDLRRSSSDSSSGEPSRTVVVSPKTNTGQNQDQRSAGADLVYFIAGSGVKGRRIMSYNLTTHESNYIALLPTDTATTHGNRSICYYNGKLFMLGGVERVEKDRHDRGGGRSSKMVRILDVDNEAKVWLDKSRTPEMTDGRSDFFSVILDDCLYAIGGSHLNFGLGSVERMYLDPVKSWKWDKVQNMKKPRNHCSVSVLDGKIYAVGGKCFEGQGLSSNVVVMSSMECYNPQLNIWILQKAMMKRSRWGLCTVVVGRTLYAMGGTEDSHSPYKKLADVEIYSLDSDRWSTAPPMNRPRAFGAAVYSAKNNYIYCLGGDDGDDSPTTEIFDVHTSKWITLTDSLPKDGNFAFAGFATFK